MQDSLRVLCSDRCHTELKKLLKDGKWMTHRPPEMFGKEDHNPSPNFDTYD